MKRAISLMMCLDITGQHEDHKQPDMLSCDISYYLSWKVCNI